MARKLRWTWQALARLDAIAAYIATDNPARATSFVRELRDKTDILREHIDGLRSACPKPQRAAP